MILKTKMNVLIFLIIFLILSITPVSAELINASNPNTTNTISNGLFQDDSKALNVDVDKTLKTIESETNILKDYSNSLEHDGNMINARANDYGWKFWKWPEITMDIVTILFNTKNTGNNALNSANKLKDEINNLESELEIDSDSNINNVDNPSCEKDACSMADELTKSSNTSFTANDVKATDLRKGDIVQYLSQGKYPRYLAVQEIKIKNNTSRKLLDYTPSDMTFLVLKGSGDKLIEVPRMGECIKVVPINNVDTGATLQNTVLIQQKNINKTKKHAQKLQKDSEILKTTAQCISALIVLYGALTLLLSGSGGLTIACPPVSITLFTLSLGSAVLCGVMSIIAGTLYLTYLGLDGKFTELYTSAKLNENDLNSYTVIAEKNKIEMNITTFDGLPVIKQPPVDDWKLLQFILVKGPEHGDLLPGPGLQFLYGPYEGYTGNDSFVFEFTDKNGKNCNVTVNVRVNPIPVFTIPGEA